MAKCGTTIKIVIDTREQTPWKFGKYKDITVVREKLDTGDYSILGHTDSICIERKSINDLVNTLLYHRDRFNKELERMQAIKHSMIVVEGSMDKIYAGKYHSKVKPNSLIGLIIATTVDFGVPLMFLPDRHKAADFAIRFLKRGCFEPKLNKNPTLVRMEK